MGVLHLQWQFEEEGESALGKKKYMQKENEQASKQTKQMKTNKTEAAAFKVTAEDIAINKQ